jgi:hypothetical protein
MADKPEIVCQRTGIELEVEEELSIEARGCR